MAMSSNGILMLTSNYAPGYKVTKVLGLVYGITVRSRGVGGNLMAGFRAIKGGKSTSTPSWPARPDSRLWTDSPSKRPAWERTQC